MSSPPIPLSSDAPSPIEGPSAPRARAPGVSGRGARRRRARPPRELREAGISVRKTLGQHFLTRARTLRRIAEAAELSPHEDVIEIGAGLGGLTKELSARAGRVIAIELDDGLANYLRRRFANSNVQILHSDALAIDPAQARGRGASSGPYVVAGNLPYRIAQPLLRHFLEARPAPRRLVVMVQAEVAKSIVSGPGERTLLGVSVQLYGEPRVLFRVPPSAFYPPPKVRSAVVAIDVSPRLRAGVTDTEAFFRVARAGFGTRRKQIRNGLAHGLDIKPAEAAALLAAAGIDPTLRPQALTLDQWAALAGAWTQRGSPGNAP